MAIVRLGSILQAAQYVEILGARQTSKCDFQSHKSCVRLCTIVNFGLTIFWVREDVF